MRSVDGHLTRMQRANPQGQATDCEKHCENEKSHFNSISINFQENEIDKMYLKVSKVVTSRPEATTLVIHLGIKRHDVTYYVTNYDVRDAAYEFLCWAEYNYTPVERWEKIIEALKALEQNTTIKELQLTEKQETTKRKVIMIITQLYLIC